MAKSNIGLLGATSLVGECLIPMLIGKNWRVLAYSRNEIRQNHDSVEWRRLQSLVPQPASASVENIPYWICLAPIYVLPDYFEMLKSHGVKRIIALSSTSRFTKSSSNEPKEKELAETLATSEERLKQWSEANRIEWIVFRPTLIYGYGRDKNISEIARFIARFGFFPLFGAADGLRQPLHADDVAEACVAALTSTTQINLAFNLSGGESIAYKDMVIRVFEAFNLRPKLISIPLFLFRLAISGLRFLPQFRDWSASMAERMNTDMSFDHSEAAKAFDFSPRLFKLSKQDLPKPN